MHEPKLDVRWPSPGGSRQTIRLPRNRVQRTNRKVVAGKDAMAQAIESPKLEASLARRLPAP